jgi:aldose 1-epimerase
MARCATITCALAMLAAYPAFAATEETALTIAKAPWGTMPSGEKVDLYTLANASGMKVTITNYGGIVVSIETPDRDGKTADVALGYDSLEAYLKETPYFGSIVGRFGNRIDKGRFSLDGVEYQLATNDGPNHLHGGIRGFDKHLWDAEPVENADSVGLRLTRTSPDSEEGYPGALTVTVTYLLDNRNALAIHYEATTDAPTVLNLTNHSYFNLAGQGERDILGHVLRIPASRFTPVNETLIPTGELAPVAGTPLDFTKATPVGERINGDHVQLVRGIGYDHNFVLDREGDGLALAAEVYEPGSGRVMQVWTTEPAIQFYSGNFLDGTLSGKGGKVYEHRFGFCLETQHYPDSPNQPVFPSTVLRPGETYRQTTEYRFSVR